MDSSVSPKDENSFLRVCHHISNAVYLAINKRGGVEAQLRASLTSTSDGGWSPSRSDHFKLSIAIYKRRSCGRVKRDELFRRRAKRRLMRNTRLYSFKNHARDCISAMQYTPITIIIAHKRNWFIEIASCSAPGG